MILKIKHFRNVKIIKKEVNGINNLKNERTAQSMFEFMNHSNAITITGKSLPPNKLNAIYKVNARFYWGF